ncbi:CbtA family protein [Devosia sp.]|uniref:CbtA family protein n=1 Tax=Devosia sp. TaxID=1871048 RepID=UPI003266A426
MKLFQRIFFAAVLAGLAAGLVMSGLQQWKVAPLILAAEVYEDAEAAAAEALPHDHAATTAPTAAIAAPAAHEHAADEWKPDNGLPRIAFTVLADILASIGFALVLVAISVVAKLEITVKNGLIWGLAGWITLHLAPAFGLPPELPGMPAADLVARQTWWVATALCTGGAFLLLAKWKNTAIAIPIAAALILIPHIVGAPPQPEEASSVPAHLATSFAASALAASAVFWLLVGPLIGYFTTLLAKAEAKAPRAVAA